MTKFYKISIIIVNWNSGSQLRECLSSVVDSDTHNIELDTIVIDNASSDDSLENIPQNVKIVKNDKNLGFAASCNIGFRFSKDSDFTLLLNPDTIIGKTTIQDSVNYISANPEISILGCKHHDEQGMVRASCARSPKLGGFISDIFGLSKIFPTVFHSATIMNDRNYNESMYVDQVIGAYMMIRNDLFNKIGYFDERFFVYFEEADFSYRSKLIGEKTYYNADIEIFHKGGGTSENVKAKRLFYSLYSRIQYGFKHFNIIEQIILVVVTLFIEPITRIFFVLMSLEFKSIAEVLQAYKFLFRALVLGEKKHFG